MAFNSNGRLLLRAHECTVREITLDIIRIIHVETNQYVTCWHILSVCRLTISFAGILILRTSVWCIYNTENTHIINAPIRCSDHKGHVTDGCIT